MGDWVTSVIDRLGYVGVAFLVALENVFPPIPSEAILPFAGFSAARGDSWLVGMIVAATVGSVTGALVLYWLARLLGPVRVRSFIERHHRWLRVTTDDLNRSEAWFDTHSTSAVLICRCVPLIRSLVSIPAGLRHMNVAQFVLYTTVGSAIWNTALVCAGYFVGDNWKHVEEYVGVLQYIVYAFLAAGLGYFVWRRFLNASTND